MPDTLPPAVNAATGPIRLTVNWAEALASLEQLGPVRVVTANTVMTHEKEGSFGNVSAMGQAIIVLNQLIDLRIFPKHWQQSYYEPVADAIRIHDGAGQLIHTICRTNATDPAAWIQFIARHVAVDQSPLATGTADEVADTSTTTEDAVDIAGLRTAWAAMTDVHEFHSMLKRFGTGRLQALGLAGEEFARPIPLSALSQLLEAARDTSLQIMIFAGNNGCIQIHTGTISRLRDNGAILWIDDPGFRLRCDTSRLASAWVVFKPTGKGGITTVELYDDQGENCAILCAQRDEDKPERAQWRALAQSLPIIAAAA